jgi:hypothetical protein
MSLKRLLKIKEKSEIQIKVSLLITVHVIYIENNLPIHYFINHLENESIISESEESEDSDSEPSIDNFEIEEISKLFPKGGRKKSKIK